MWHLSERREMNAGFLRRNLNAGDHLKDDALDEIALMA